MIQKSSIAYRRGELEDIEHLAKIRVDFLHEVIKIEQHDQKEILEQELYDYFYEAMSNKRIIFWLAEQDNQIVATSSLVIWDAPFGYRGLGKKGRRGYILNMFTAKSYRRKGIAHKLLEKLIVEARKLELEYLHLNATQDGQNVYERLGFREPKFPEMVLDIS